MKHQNVIGIYMDHAKAELIEYTQNKQAPESIVSSFTHDIKVTSIGKSEQLMHNKEQHEQHDYYKKLGEEIKNYNAVLLFGPTSAKSELHNLLKADHRFENIKIETQQTDKMTENQQHAFVRDHFSKQY